MFFVPIDTETTLNGDRDTVGLGHPMHPDNHIVYWGTQGRGDVVPAIYANALYYPAEETSSIEEDLFITLNLRLDVDTVLCGQNIAFDLLHIYKASPKTKALIQRNRIWDIQLAEYILTAQRSKYASLDAMSKKYDLPIKEDKIKEYFAAGIGADKIPETEIVPYLSQDVANTKAIAEKQWVLAEKEGQLALIFSQMEALQATVEMMFNGLYINKDVLDKYTLEVVNDYAISKVNLEALCPTVDDIDSPKQWSTFFFGGEKKIKEKEVVGTYKNGKVKTKLVEKIKIISGITSYIPPLDKVSGKTGQISVDEFVLNGIIKLHLSSTDKARKSAESLLKYRELSKQLSTYVHGLSIHVIDNKIHGNLNHTATVTGRLSSTHPNLQNISNNPIKKIFESRFVDGYLVEVDFNQLEVVALAHLSRDKQLIKDISSGTDIHSALYNQMYGRMPTKEERKPFKSRTFQLIYGAGASAIAKQAGIGIREAKEFVDVFYTRYKGVKLWHDDCRTVVDATGSYLEDEESLREKFRSLYWFSETGRKFYFKEYYNDKEDSPAYGTYSFSPTELKNYPVQGLATGDIVPMMLGRIFQTFINQDGVKMINTIHDSVLFDVKEEVIGNFIVEVVELLRNTHKVYEETFGKPLALKLNAGVSYGKNWYEMKEIEV